MFTQDADGDTRPEFLVYSGYSGGTAVYFDVWTGTTITGAFTWPAPGGTQGFIDIDGDGIEELLSYDQNYYSGLVNVGAVYIKSRTGTIRRAHFGAVGNVYWPNILLWAAWGPLGDLDGDGIDDYMGKYSLNNFYFPVASGRTGDMLTYAYGRGWKIGDIDDDGFDELASTLDCVNINHCPGGVAVQNGRTGALMWMQWGDFHDHRLGLAVSCVDDIDGDGSPDLIVSGATGAGAPIASPLGTVRAYSGASGGVLWSRDETWPFAGFANHMVAGPDWNADGIPDVAVTQGPLPQVQILSGVDGQTFQTLPHRPPVLWYQQPEQFGWLHLGGDLDGDGSVELLTSSVHQPTEPAPNAGTLTAWSLTTGSTAHRRYRGASCQGSNGHYPRIDLRTPPRLGTVAKFRLRAALPNTQAFLCLGWSHTHMLGAGPCHMHVVPVAFGAPVVTNGDGFARYDIPIPNTAALRGLELCANWLTVDLPANGYGVTTSNACEIVLGG